MPSPACLIAACTTLATCAYMPTPTAYTPTPTNNLRQPTTDSDSHRVRVCVCQAFRSQGEKIPDVESVAKAAKAVGRPPPSVIAKLAKDKENAKKVGKATGKVKGTGTGMMGGRGRGAGSKTKEIVPLSSSSSSEEEKEEDEGP
eukprot:scaffold1911_cov181-Isochrysis_galbana.AAC.1